MWRSVPKFALQIDQAINFLPLKTIQEVCIFNDEKQASFIWKLATSQEHNGLVKHKIYLQKLSTLIVSSGSHREGDGERKEQVHPKLHNTHSSNQRIPEGGVRKAVTGRGWNRDARKARSFQRQNTIRHRRAQDTRPRIVFFFFRQGQLLRSGPQYGKFGRPAPQRGLLPNPLTLVSAKQATFPESRLAFSFPYPRPILTGPAVRDGSGEH